MIPFTLDCTRPLALGSGIIRPTNCIVAVVSVFFVLVVRTDISRWVIFGTIKALLGNRFGCSTNPPGAPIGAAGSPVLAMPGKNEITVTTDMDESTMTTAADVITRPETVSKIVAAIPKSNQAPLLSHWVLTPKK
jgi:hypothetical protein